MTSAQGVKVILCGESTVGKTTLLKAITGQNVNEPISPTMAAAFTILTLKNPQNGEKIVFNIWDTAGQEAYRSLIKVYFRTVQIALIVFDVTNSETFEKIDQWINDINSNAGTEKYKCIIVANKLDRESERTVTKEELSQKGFLHGTRFVEVSAMTGENINDLKNLLIEMHNNPMATRPRLKSIYRKEPIPVDPQDDELLPENHYSTVILTEGKKKHNCCK
ncbi:Ras family protein [Trichomonas vaginalis G3]|uniref:Ras family protein n=1 Tax=Trichomonas vaginalis (strain ATCC PRA-98 / G3) TaxID=412133 RepID=A2EWE4_TRIV3|nr:GTPase protein [Trichomonas vaginalis G3]EAY03048.1 Ras family protein [Trichomonas vaginalis G3]KAI5531472.1 GTPase protein [Trichomonas vaginalis G3]|eukprot:XP_001315271.1 Ras family protein [Trichomonas vaginalis G3]